MTEVMDSSIVALLVGIINFLSLIIIAGLSFFLKSLWADMKQVRKDVDILRTEHDLLCGNHATHKQNHESEEDA